jgi:hypothetical protein
MDALMSRAVVGMVSGSSVGVSGYVGGGGWWMILCSSEEQIFDLADFIVSADTINCFKIQTIPFLTFI